MKKKLLILLALLAISMLSLTGCSGVKDFIGEQMLRESGIKEDANYKEYERYSEDGLIDVNGYCAEAAGKSAESLGSIHVTFAQNNNLHVQYYTDEAHYNAVDVSACYLEPGDSLYAVVQVDEEVHSSMYRFAGFRIYEIDEEGKRVLSPSIHMEEDDDELILKIPEDFSGRELAIEPIGAYQKRVITLNDYCSDENGNTISLDGTWIVNDKEYTSDSVEISPVESYIISYEYDSEEYFYLSSSPECYYSNNEDGLVIFNQRNADDKTVEYSVELHKYISVTLVSDTDRIVTIGNDGTQYIGANGELTISRLKYGDTVTIQTNKAWPGLDTNRELILTNTEPLSGGYYKYSFIVPEKDGEFIFNPSDYTYEHGKITFMCFGQPVTNTQILAKGTRIYYEAASSDDGYWLAGDVHCIIVGDTESTIEALKEIHFTPMVDVTVFLPQPKAGGTVTYYLNGKRVYGTSVSTYSGAVVTMKFNPWEGWISSFAGEVTYSVGDSKSQTVDANGVSINEVFREDAGHKPELTLKLEKSVGEAMKFSLAASGYSMDVSSYGSGWNATDIVSGTYNILTKSQIVVDKQKIGTDRPIVLEMSNRAIQYGTAVRMVITRTDSKNNKTTEIMYIDDLSNKIDPIYIYQPGSNATSTVWYKSIEITIGVVDVENFLEAKPAANTKITVKNADTNEVLSNGDLIEESTKVVVTISPLSGYYVTGNKVTNDVYQETMKYSNYKRNISSIISNHPAGRYFTITLDKSDAYASYTYKLDGEVVSGTITVKAGQKLELTYEITDSAYRLKQAHGGFIFGWGASYTKATKTITINASYEGKTVTKADFNIATVKGS